MNEREFLKKIRDMEKQGKTISLTEIKKTNKGLIIESGFEDTTLDGGKVYDLDNPDDETIPSDEQREEEQKFKDAVSKLVKFEKIKVKNENVEWSGTLVREKIDWTFSLDETIGCYIRTEDFIQLKDEHIAVIKKIRGYYDIWSEEWAGRLTGAEGDEQEDEGF